MANTTSTSVRWAIRGKQPGQLDGYSILSDDSGGRRQEEYARLVSGLVTSNPSTAPAGQPSALPWVYIAPFEADGAGPRLAMTKVEWPAQEIRDHNHRRISMARYFDVPLADVWRAGSSYLAFYQALDVLSPADGQRADCAFPTADLGQLADYIDQTGFDRLLLAAAGLLESVVVVLSDPSTTAPVDRLRCLDGIAALLPYGMRADLAVGTWTPNDTPHRLRLVFSDRVADGQRRSRPGERLTAGPPAALTSQVAQDYADRMARLRSRIGTRVLVERLWQDRQPYRFATPDTVLDSLAMMDRPYAVLRDVRRGTGGVEDIVEVLRRPDTDLSLIEPEEIGALTDLVLERPPPADLDVLARHWHVPPVRDRVVAAAVACDPPSQATSYLRVARRAGAEAAFLTEVVGAVRSSADRGRVARLLAGQAVPLDPAIRDALLNDPELASRLLVSELTARGTVSPGPGWADLLFRPDRSLMPEWAHPFLDVRAGAPRLTREHIEARGSNLRWELLGLLAVAARMGQPAAFLTCDNAWSRLFAELDRRDPELVTEFSRVAAVLPRLPGAGRASLDLLMLAGGEMLTWLACDVRDPAVLRTYYPEVSERFDRMRASLRPAYARRLAQSAVRMGLDERRMDFILQIAEQAGLPDRGRGLHTMLAEAAADRPHALAGLSQEHVDYLVALSPALGRRFQASRVSSAARYDAQAADLARRCAEAVVAGVSIEHLLPQIQEWPGLDEPQRALHLFEKLGDEATRLGYPQSSPSLTESGLRFVLNGGLGRERAHRLARSLASHLRTERSRLVRLRRLVRRNKPPKRATSRRWRRNRGTRNQTNEGTD